METGIPPSKFENEIRDVINRNSMENVSDTPDFLLAEYLNKCLTTWNLMVEKREQWYGRKCGNGISILGDNKPSV